MKRLILVSAIFIFTSCAPKLTSDSGMPIKAIYLTQINGQLLQEDLQAHPEVLVTSSFDEFKKLARTKVALWIDTNAIGAVDRTWLNQNPQRDYPIVLVGQSNDLCSFRDILGVGTIEGPGPVDCSSPPPGFSIWMIQKETIFETSAFMHGFEQTPMTQDILDITNSLLEGNNPLLETIK